MLAVMHLLRVLIQANGEFNAIDPFIHSGMFCSIFVISLFVLYPSYTIAKASQTGKLLIKTSTELIWHLKLYLKN